MAEWFDWSVYASFATYYAGSFFPGGNPTAQLMNTLGIFAVGLRPNPSPAQAGPASPASPPARTDAPLAS
ncbi:Alpha-ketoglutarate permease [Streptomyces sp. ADI96-15]|uniref:hypothetical protein n=1 Tax=Streptomyces sp. ADI96-15 TaxID=1522761 RepID=UPI000F54CFA5|nr:hypothetical protein [Streptomyces sp. ADI96-15]RPK59178.1 Alpha-ketoglutarate permease [Streptomyces sp. ADI96-15]